MAAAAPGTSTGRATVPLLGITLLTTFNVLRVLFLPRAYQALYTDSFEALIAVSCIALCLLAASRADVAQGPWRMVAAYFSFLAVADFHDILVDLHIALPNGFPGLVEALGWCTYLPLALLIFYPLTEQRRGSWNWLSFLDYVQVSLVLGSAYFHYIYLPHAIAHQPWTVRGRAEDLRNVVLAAGLLLRGVIDPSMRMRSFYRRVGGAFTSLTLFQAIFQGVLVSSLDEIGLLGRPVSLMLLGVFALRWRSLPDKRSETQRSPVGRWTLDVVPALGPVLVLMFGVELAEHSPVTHRFVVFTSIGIFLARRWLAESRRQAGVRLQDALQEIARQASGAKDLRQLCAAMHGLVASLIDARSCYIALYDAKLRAWSFPQLVDQQEPIRPPEDEVRAAAELALREGALLIITATQLSHSLEKQSAKNEPQDDWVVVPLKSAGATLGVMVVRSHDVRFRYGEEEKTALSVIAEHVAAAIERQKAEDRLRQSQDRLALAQKAAQIGSFDWNTQTKTLIWSAEMEDLHGLARGAFGGRAEDWEALILPDDLERSHAVLRSGFEVEDRAAEWRIVRANDGQIRWMSVRAKLFPGAEGQPSRLIGISQDITERKRLEEHLLQSQKLEAIGWLAGGIAHDFNNILGVINGYSEIILDGPDVGAATRPKLQAILHAGQRAAGLTQQLLAFSRKQVLQPRVVSLNRIVEDINKMLRRLIGKDIEVKTILAPRLNLVKVDPSQMEQVILNLSINAHDAMPEGGRLVIGTDNVDFSREPRSAHPLTMRPGPYVRLTVSDTGTGMDKETLSHVFEPFYTTKGPKGGTGLGLATVYGIVKQSGGYVWAYSEPGHGSIFSVYLPKAMELEETERDEPAQEEVLGGSETILLVEDVDALRELTRDLLKGCGYTVLEAADGEQALRVAAEYPGHIAMLLTDVTLPKIKGPILVKTLMQHRVGLKVLFMSGYTDDTIIDAGALPSGTLFLQKPFTARELAKKVREILDTPLGTAARHA